QVGGRGRRRRVSLRVGAGRRSRRPGVNPGGARVGRGPARLPDRVEIVRRDPFEKVVDRVWSPVIRLAPGLGGGRDRWRDRLAPRFSRCLIARALWLALSPPLLGRGTRVLSRSGPGGRPAGASTTAGTTASGWTTRPSPAGQPAANRNGAAGHRPADGRRACGNRPSAVGGIAYAGARRRVGHPQSGDRIAVDGVGVLDRTLLLQDRDA